MESLHVKFEWFAGDASASAPSTPRHAKHVHGERSAQLGVLCGGTRTRHLVRVNRSIAHRQHVARVCRRVAAPSRVPHGSP
jgi:hypothetical protein